MKLQTFEERLLGAKCIDPSIAFPEILLTFYSHVIRKIWSRLQEKDIEQKKQ